MIMIVQGILISEKGLTLGSSSLIVVLNSNDSCALSVGYHKMIFVIFISVVQWAIVVITN